MNSYKLQTRYAQSLFDLSQEQGISSKVYEDMLLVMQVCVENHELRTILKNPVIKSDNKKAIVNDIFQNHVQELSLAFMDLLIVKRRDVLLYEIAEKYTEIFKEFNGVKTVLISTATALDDKETELLKNKIETELGSKIDLQTKVNPKLIGGFCLLVHGMQYDASFMNQIAKLKKEFTKNVYEKVF
jgi:F-type H+-transporting ATPase subunit delta